MKLRFTTKSFIISTFLFALFRFLQIAFLTDSETKFLKSNLIWLNILLTILCLIPMLYTVANTYYAFRCPKAIGKTGICGAVIGIISGIFMLIPALQIIFSENPSVFSILLPLLGAAACFLLAANEMFDFSLPKFTFLLPLASNIYFFVTAYTVYTGRPLRVRTVYEIFALVFSILFYLYISKAHCLVKPTTSFRLLYPLGFLAATFCFLSFVPDMLAFFVGFKNNVTTPCTYSLSLFGSGIFITYLTLASNTYKNTEK